MESVIWDGLLNLPKTCQVSLLIQNSLSELSRRWVWAAAQPFLSVMPDTSGGIADGSSSAGEEMNLPTNKSWTPEQAGCYGGSTVPVVNRTQKPHLLATIGQMPHKRRRLKERV